MICESFTPVRLHERRLRDTWALLPPRKRRRQKIRPSRCSDAGRLPRAPGLVLLVADELSLQVLDSPRVTRSPARLSRTDSSAFAFPFRADQRFFDLINTLTRESRTATDSLLSPSPCRSASPRPPSQASAKSKPGHPPFPPPFRLLLGYLWPRTASQRRIGLWRLWRDRRGSARARLRRCW